MHEVLTLQEAAEYLRCHPDTVKRRARSGELPAAKIGRAWRFRRAELEGWLAEGGSARTVKEDAGLLLAMDETSKRLGRKLEALPEWEEVRPEEQG